MDNHDDECIWVRTDVWLDTGDGAPVQVQTRKLCNKGAFLEYTGPIDEDAVEVIFPEPGSKDGGRRVYGMVARRWPDGIWVKFNRDLRSSSEILMRSGLSRAVRTYQQAI